MTEGNGTRQPQEAAATKSGKTWLRWAGASLWMAFVGVIYLGLWKYFGGDSPQNEDWIQAFGFFMAAFGVGPIGLMLADERAKLQTRQTELQAHQTQNDIQRRVTEASTQAMQLLGHKEVAVRQGGIHALERIAAENPAEHEKIMSTLTVHVREGSRRHANKLNEIVHKASSNLVSRKDALPLALLRQEAATGIGDVPEPEWLKFLGELLGEHENSHRVQLEYLLWRQGMPSDVEAAAHALRRGLTGAERDPLNSPGGVNLSGARLYRANLTGIRLPAANLSYSHAHFCFLVDADLSRSLMRRASFINTDFRGARLQDADMALSEFAQANFRGTDLRGALGLTQEQIDKALGNKETQLPRGLSRPKHWLPSK